MACVNVNTNVSDQFYRYKMPRLIAKVEGKGNGIKTVVVNMPEIAKALSRPPKYPTKYFGCELGAQTQFDLKNDRYIVNGAHEAIKLQGLLDGFIKKFVLCPQCSNPETNLVILSRKQLILQRCIACGYQGPVDMNHKLTTFILKNPPDQDNQAQATSKSKKSKKSKKQESVNGDCNSPEANAQEQMAAQRASGGDILAPPEAQDAGDDDDWTEDFSEAAVRERMRDLTSAAKGLTLTDDLEKTQEERMNILYNFIKQKHESKTLAGADKDILAEAERLEIKEKCPTILVELLFNADILKQIKEHKKLLLRFCNDSPKAQKYLLSGIEILVGKIHKDVLMSKVPHILKTLYDEDILDEDVILKWAAKPTKNHVSKSVAEDIREKAKPFIKWLEEAEVEDSDKDGSDDEEIAYSPTEVVSMSEPKNEDEDDDESGADIDIDAI
ncbi:eukaryotic translation initiation factor 5-like [Octopus vulgaris]|uniref:Eukaryotic translation initiation factor 5 n=1 Tax=Octopus vulgaris TaxID=6645 RepID=A0AA36FD18_OCTVU|nr:eukaryotic translation initiation factor 5-like [Octopus vulgaris]